MLNANDFWVATKNFIKDRPAPEKYNLTQNSKDQIDALLPLVLNPLNHNNTNKSEHSTEIERTIKALKRLKSELGV